MQKISVCPICKSTLQTFLKTKDHFNTGEAFTLDQCPCCQLLVTNPQPEPSESGKYYSSENYLSHHAENKNPLSVLYRKIRYYNINSKIKLIFKYSSGTRVLDYGCGTGDFLQGCLQRGWTVNGMEPDKDARRIASNKINKSVFSSRDQIEETYDIITLWHVLEHLHDPVDALRYLKERLGYTGRIILALPNYKSPDASFYQSFWAGYDVPRHLFHFTQSTVSRLASETGLVLVATHPMKLDSFYVSLLSEGYIRPGQFPYLRAFRQGWLSNQKAKANNNYSSLIYVLDQNN